MVLSEAKAWILGHALVILGVALALTAGYAAWLTWVTVPSLKKDVAVAESAMREAKANVETIATVNKSLAISVDRCNASVDALAQTGKQTQEDVGKVLRQLGAVGANVKAQLGAFKPDANKSDCENAKAELQKFKAVRQ